MDYNATTPIAPSVIDAMMPFLTTHYGNPSSDHALGRACFHAIEDARENVARLLNAESDEVLFTSGGSESNNLAILGVADELNAAGKRHFITTAIEHPAVSRPFSVLQERGFEITVVSCDSRGVVDAQQVIDSIRDDTALVSVMHANNETGAIQPIEVIGSACRERGVLFHVDAAQSIGKVPTDVQALSADLLTVVGHKMYAPKGSGALSVRTGFSLQHHVLHQQVE